MKITVEEITKEQEEEIILRCHEMNSEMAELVDLLVRVMTYTRDWKTAEDINRKIRERRSEKHEKE